MTKGPTTEEAQQYRKGGKGKNSKEIRKLAQQDEKAELMASKPTRIKRGKEGVNGPSKPKEWSSKSMGIIRGKEEVNELGKPRK